MKTVFLDFVTRFNNILMDARIHVFDGYWQDTTFSMLFENGSKVLSQLCECELIILFLFEIFPPNTVMIHDDWSTNMKVRTSVNLTPQQWRSAKDCAIQNFLLRIISGKDDDRGIIFDERVIHFLCDVSSTKTVASCMNFESVLDYVMDNVDYEVKLIIR